MNTPHTLSVVEKEMHALAAGINAMGALVAQQLTDLLDALRRADAAALAAVAARDGEVDAFQARIEEQVMSLLVRLQPVARDLRSVLAGQLVALELERSGDHVKRIAKQLGKIPGTLPSEISSRLLWFGNQARALLQRALNAYHSADAAQARQAWADDVELDRMYHGFLSDLLARMRGDGDWVDIGVRLVGIAKSMERIGDHATNIAEEARFVALGEIMPARRGSL
ncbi:MAG TPA: phosphate signaling complex protein PhoU [Steroidobacteraceae bacterium]|nr:phosphate signaling complex protein PhoU [Steroidobacteraceae bacterium]